MGIYLYGKNTHGMLLSDKMNVKHLNIECASVVFWKQNVFMPSCIFITLFF